MALTAGIVRASVPGDRREVTVDLRMDTAYPAGGYPVTPDLVGLGKIDSIQLGGVTTGLVWSWNPVTSMLQAWKPGAINSPMVEAAAADVSKNTQLRCIAKGSQ